MEDFEQKLTRSSGHRRRLFLPLRSVLGRLLRKVQETRETMGIEPRNPPPPTLLPDRPLPHNQLLLARLVRKANRPLDRARLVRPGVRTRIPNDLHLAPDICHGRVQNLLCQRIGSVCNYAERCWSAITSCCRSALCETGGCVGYFSSWICQPCVYPDPVCVALLWSLDSCEESLLSEVVGGGYAQS